MTSSVTERRGLLEWFRWPTGAVVLALVLAVAACGGRAPAPTSPGPDETDEPGDPGALPALGHEATLDVGTWNLEWFGDPERGPADDARQLDNVAAVVAALQVDLWSVQEVVDGAHFQELLERLPGYGGFLADDPIVEGGAEWYGDFDGNELKVGLVYRTSQVTVLDARVVLTDFDYFFAGRPPVEVRLNVGAGAPEEVVVLLLHAKAGADPDDWERRSRAAEALEEYLDERWPDEVVMVVGDFNDDVDTSITDGRASSYADLVASPEWIFLTAALSAAGESSTVFYPDVIDHHMVSDELAARYVDGSATVFRADRYLELYGETTSDHYPVVSLFGPAPGTEGAAGGRR